MLTQEQETLSASPAWAVELWSEPRHWPLDICWPSAARDSWLVDVKANLAKICAELPSAPFSSTIVPLPLWEWGQRLSWKLWGSLTLIRRSLWCRGCAHTSGNGEVGLQGVRARAVPNISVTHCTSPACWTLAKSFQFQFWTFPFYPSWLQCCSLVGFLTLGSRGIGRRQRKVFGRGGWREGGVRVEQSPPKIRARGAL